MKELKILRQQQSAPKERGKGYHLPLMLDTICIPQVYFLSAINKNLKVASHPVAILCHIAIYSFSQCSLVCEILLCYFCVELSYGHTCRDPG